MKVFQRRRLNFNLIVLFMFVLIKCLSVSSSRSPKDTVLSKIRTKGKWFVDEVKRLQISDLCDILLKYNFKTKQTKKDDRIMLFHGINVVEKNFPWYYEQGHQNLNNKTNLENLKKWGFNTIRLGMITFKSFATRT